MELGTAFIVTNFQSAVGCKEDQQLLDFTADADAESDGDDKVGNTLKHCQASLLQTVPPPPLQ
jgi:hypothetical protein